MNFYRIGSIFETKGTDKGPFQIHHDRDVFVFFEGSSLDVRYYFSLLMNLEVVHVDTGYIHTFSNHFCNGFLMFSHSSKCADNFG